MNKPATDLKPEAEVVTAPHVLQAITAVMEEMAREGISKSRSNTQQGYKFRGIDDVYNALAPVLARHNLVVTPRVMSRQKEVVQTAKGGTLFYVTVDMEFELASSIDGTTKVARMFGEAMDSGDKATNKAMSAAYKYMAMQEFCIPTEGDNDADASTHQVVSAEETAVSMLKASCVSREHFADVWEKNKAGWRGVLDDAAYARLIKVMRECAAKLPKPTQTTAPPLIEQQPDDDGRPVEVFEFDDEIPF